MCYECIVVCSCKNLCFCSYYKKVHINFCWGNSTSPVEITFQIDCMQTANLGEWCGMWYIYGLYSVLGLKLQSIYPEFNKTIRPVYNKIVEPRVSKDVSWTSKEEVNCLQKRIVGPLIICQNHSGVRISSLRCSRHMVAEKGADLLEQNFPLINQEMYAYLYLAYCCS